MTSVDAPLRLVIAQIAPVWMYLPGDPPAVDALSG